MSRGRSRSIPALFIVTRVPRVKTGENALGQPIYTEGTPEDRKVVTWYPTNETERNDAALAGRTISELTLLTLDDDWQSTDKVSLDGADYEVIGYAEDYTHNPFARNFGGYELKLKKVTDV